MKTLKLGIPKGSLQEVTFELFKKAGLSLQVGPRSYRVICEDSEIEGTLIRAQEIASYVEDGIFDAGLTGLDWIKENNAKVVHVTDLVYSKQSMRPVKWVLAVAEDSSVRSVKQLRGKRIATELVNLTKKYLRAHKVSAEVEFSWGATEVKVPDLVDAIVEVTETGASLKANKLKIIDVVLTSWTMLIANKKSWENKWKRRKLENITLLLKAAIEAEGKVGLKLNVKKKDLEKVLKVLPSITSPTISGLSTGDWVAVETILEETEVRRLMPELKRVGAEGIIEYPLNKVVF